MKVGSKEMYDLMAFFERNISKSVYTTNNFQKEPKESWQRGYYYANGEINNYFRVYMQAYELGKASKEYE